MFDAKQKQVLRAYGDAVTVCASGHHQASRRAKVRCSQWAIEQGVKTAKAIGMSLAECEALGDVAARYGYLRYCLAWRKAHAHA